MQYTGPEIIYTGNFEWRIRNGLPDVPQIEQAFADARESVNKFYAEYAAQLEKKRSARKLGWDDVEEMQINYVTAQAHLKLDRAERGILGRIRLQLLACINGYELAPGVTEAQGAFDTDARDSKQTAAPGDGNHYKTVERNMPGSEAVK